MKELNRQFFKGDKKTFECEICYEEKPKNEISYLQCGHYFCAECLKNYMLYKINQSGSSHKMDCPNQGCKL